MPSARRPGIEAAPPTGFPKIELIEETPPGLALVGSEELETLGDALGRSDIPVRVEISGAVIPISG
ncbi:hypothetical protein [Microbacterium alcoholitolerans]|uniref:hypothetical protein n=1 Tax=unclassified Microbacterium TaxID=2609290 RepID=UPI003D1746C3